MTADDPRSITAPCPACYAPKGEPCTTPTDQSRRPVSWFHYARTDTITTDSVH